MKGNKKQERVHPLEEHPVSSPCRCWEWKPTPRWAPGRIRRFCGVMACGRTFIRTAYRTPASAPAAGCCRRPASACRGRLRPRLAGRLDSGLEQAEVDQPLGGTRRTVGCRGPDPGTPPPAGGSADGKLRTGTQNGFAQNCGVDLKMAWPKIREQPLTGTSEQDWWPGLVTREPPGHKVQHHAEAHPQRLGHRLPRPTAVLLTARSGPVRFGTCGLPY